MPNKVLIIINRFPPYTGSGVFRPLKFVKYLPLSDWLPLVLTCDYGNMDRHEDSDLLKEIPEDVKILRVKNMESRSIKQNFKNKENEAKNNGTSSNVYLYNSIRWIRKKIYNSFLIPDFEVLWNKNAFKMAKKIIQEENIKNIYTSSPPNSVHLIGYKLKKWDPSLNWVADFRDVWNVHNQYMDKRAYLFRTLQQKNEFKVLKTCDYAVAISDKAAEYTIEKFGAEFKNKVTYITNGYDEYDFLHIKPVRPSKEPFLLVFTGTMLSWTANHKLIDGFYDFTQTYPDIPVKLRLVGLFDKSITGRIAQLGLENIIEIIDYVPHKEAISYMNESSILVFALEGNSMNQVTHTNKFFEYIRIKKPILCLAPKGVTTEFIEKHKIGLVAAPDDISMIRESLYKIIKNYDKYFEKDYWKDEIICQFERRNLTKQLAELLKTN